MCIFGSHTFAPSSWTYKKTNSRFAQQHRDRNHSLDAGVRMKGIPALGLWDTVNDVLEPIARGDVMRKQRQTHNAKQGNVNWRAEDFDHVPPNAHISSRRASLFLFEDTKAAIKMISKSRSSDMRHVSRTHILTGYFDQINLDQAIKIKTPTNNSQMCYPRVRCRKIGGHNCGNYMV